MILNYHFVGRSVADLLKNAEFVRNVVETDSFAFYHDGKIAIDPIPTKLLFDYTAEETNNVRQFVRDLLLVEAFYDIKVSTENGFGQEDQKWVGILAESIHGRSVPYTWSNASFTGVIHPAEAGMSVEEILEEPSDHIKYGYTAIGDLTIGTTYIGKINVRYELESARISNLQEIQAEMNKRPNDEKTAVTIKLLPCDNDRGTRRVLFG